MRIAIIYNQPKPSTAQEHWISRSKSEGTVVAETFIDASEYDVVRQAQLIDGILREASYETMLYAASQAGHLLEYLVRERPALIFNCCETLNGNPKLELNVAAVFEILDIPFTGSSALGIGLANDKSIAKALFVAHGVPTPRWAVLSPPDRPRLTSELTFPLIVKPLEEDASIGIDMNSVVENPGSLMERVDFIWKEFQQPALVEEFIDGRELNVALLAASGGQLATLPISEILFKGFPAKYPIVTFEAKWMADSPYCTATVPQCPAELSPVLEEKVRGIALRAAEAVQMRDYGRIDFRVRASDNSVFVTEANPNPDLTPEAGFFRAAQASGRTYASLIREIVERAKERTLGTESFHKAECGR